MITLYFSVASRSFVPLWLLEELGVPYETVDTDIRSRKQKAPDYLKINPMGKVPALDDGGTIVTEAPAICLYLADRYGYGTLSPKLDDPARGLYFKWCVFATAVFEPALYLPEPANPADKTGFGWGDRETMLSVLEAGLSPGPFLLGERFSAADIALGGLFTIAMFNERIPGRPVFAAYNAALWDRPAFKRAAGRTWPPELFKS